MKEKLNYRARTSFIVAGALLIYIAIGTLWDLSMFFEYMGYSITEPGYYDFTTVILPYLMEALLGIYLIVFALIIIISKKNSLPVVFVSILSVIYAIYRIIDTALQNADYGISIDVLLELVSELCFAVLCIFLIIFTIMGYVMRAKKLFFLNMWFIPLCVYAVATFIEYSCAMYSYEVSSNSIYGILDGNTYMTYLALYQLILPVALSLVCLGVNLYNKASYEDYKKQEDEHRAAELERMQYYQKTSYMPYTGQQFSPAPNNGYNYPPQNDWQTTTAPNFGMNASADHGAPNELGRYKQLLDMGAITPEEYEMKKKQILGL